MRMYSPGDVVIVRPDLRLDKFYYMKDRSAYDDVNTKMISYFAGKEVTISEIQDNNKYCLAEDSDGWNWTDEMFVGLAPKDEQLDPEYFIGIAALL